MTFAETRAAIASRSTARKIATIDGLWSVMEAMRKKGVRVFSVTNVGRACEAAGVIKVQSLRNATGSDFRDLIASYAEDIGASTSNAAGPAPTPVDEAIDTIRDLDVRIRLRLIVENERRQTEEISRLKQAFKLYRLAPDQEPSTAALPVLSGEVLPPEPLLAAVDVVPLWKFLSHEYLAEQGLEIRSDGAVYDDRGERLTPLGFAFSLQALLSATTRLGC